MVVRIGWRRHTSVAAALAVAALAGCGGSDEGAAAAAVVTAGEPPPTESAPTTVDPTTTTTVAATTTTGAPASTSSTATTSTTIVLPQPIAPPADDGATEPVVEVGSIAIPAIGVAMTMYEGILLSTLDHGPGHWPGSALPGQVGNVVVAGHRTSKHKVFRHLDQLAPGDEIVFDGTGGRFVYVVTYSEIVTPDALRIIEQTPARTATLFACHPPGSTRERIVVHAELAT